MPSRTLPNLGLEAFFLSGEDGWDDEMSLNLLKLSVLTQGRASSKVAVEPGSPTDGDVHILNETHATHPNEIAIRDDGAWVYVTPLSGWLLYNVAAGYYEKYDADEGRWAELETGGGSAGGGSALNHISTTSLTGASVIIDLPDSGLIHIVVRDASLTVSGRTTWKLLSGGADVVFDHVSYLPGGGAGSSSATAQTEMFMSRVDTSGSIQGWINLFGANNPSAVTSVQSNSWSSAGDSITYRDGMTPTGRSDQIEFVPSAGNFDGGTVEIWALETAPASGGGLVKLGSIEAVGGEASLTVDNIPTGYENLIVTGSARGSANADISLTFNGDSGANYDFDRQFAGGAEGGEANNGQTAIDNLWGVTNTASVFSALRMTILGYARTDRWKAFEGAAALRSASGNRFTAQAAGYWKDTDAVTSITATPSTGTFAAGSRLDVWGMGESSIGKSAIFEDQKAANTAGGASVAGSWLTRDLNTEVFDDIGISLAANQLSLPAGTYDVEASSEFYRTDRVRARLQNVTDGITLALSSTIYGLSSTSGDNKTAVIAGRFTLANAAIVELQYRVQTALAGNGLGVESNFGVTEIYSRVKLTKIA